MICDLLGPVAAPEIFFWEGLSPFSLISPSLPSSFLSHPPLPLSPPLEVEPQIQLGGLGSAVSSPQRGLGLTPEKIDFGKF